MDGFPGQELLECSESEGKGVVRLWIVLPVRYDVEIFQKLVFCILYWKKGYMGVDSI